MRLTILNLTDEAITASLPTKDKYVSEQALLPPSLSTTTHSLKGYRSKLTLKPSNIDPDEDKKWLIHAEGLSIKLSMALGASWQVVTVPEGCQWRIYISRITRKHHKLLIFPRRDMSSFLSEMPDRLPLSSLVLPGTHDTMALHGWPISQCQSPSTPLMTQLNLGIRVLDVRLSIISGRLISYHGIYPQRTPFKSILADIHEFLTSPTSSRETLVMSIKQEDFVKTHPADFSRLVREEIEASPGGMGMWFLENRVPRLGEVRGRVVMFSRFGMNGEGWEGGLEGLGMHPLSWPDSEKWGFSWQCKETLVRTHDWYAIPSFLAIPEKVALSTQILLPPTPQPPMPTLAITYFSAASFPLAMPPTIAQGFGWPKWGFGVEGVNSRVGRWLLGMLGGGPDLDNFNVAGEKEKTEGKMEEPRIRGWTLMDYCDHPEESGVVPLLVECNYRGRKEGEEGW
ncbi:PLC-like phosphodiesterase [Crucibulum laeve]|uniref:PLC-like phosphodiesterase n=1 Tax=Crucibulum laeve TaxID=68775 RepID=A0A5C3LQ19_9AGAR|nr:PLC-like phosphodiesterase [Crucibulum laeve]